MGVYIKGMEMPKGCATCPYCDRAWNKPKCKAKSMQGRFMEQRLNLDRTRQKWCPLVPVPPHCLRISALESQKAKGDSIFGGGFLLSKRAAAERAAAERAAAERWDLTDIELCYIDYMEKKTKEAE